ncbi:MAG: rebO [Ilumatobacteraceae bacterium]|nr:rebO [Ilumatobacteraceae bacterium]
MPASQPAAVRPISWHVARWGEDPFSRGSWSYIRPGGSPADRRTLAEPIGDRFVLCGEAVGTEQPAMTHGAFESGVRAGGWCRDVGSPSERVVIVGAGFAGLGAARTLVDAGIECVLVEARDRIGGRAHTVDLPGPDGSFAAADAGAAWLQQFGRNEFALVARSLGITPVSTDFHAPLAGAADGPAGDVPRSLAMLADAARAATAGDVADVSLADVLGSLPASERDAPAMRRAIDADVVLETGAATSDTSARWFFAEDGVGNDDHWIPGGYRQLVDHLATGLDIRLGRPVRSIAWDGAGVVVHTDAGELRADRCICSLPISLLQRGDPVLSPGLPAPHREALGRLGMGVVEKVILRFAERWWPHPPHGYLRWYDTPTSWAEWVDLTDGCGAPVVAGLIAHDAVARHHHGRNDEEVALAATDALRRWADAVTIG